MSIEELISKSTVYDLNVVSQMHSDNHPKECECLAKPNYLLTRLMCKNTSLSVFLQVKEFLQQQQGCRHHRPLQYTMLHHGTCKLPPLKKEDEEILNLEEAPDLEKMSEPVKELEHEETVVRLLLTFVEIFCELTRVEKDLLSIAGFSTRAALFDHIASGGALNHRIKRAAAVAEKFLKERK